MAEETEPAGLTAPKVKENKVIISNASSYDIVFSSEVNDAMCFLPKAKEGEREELIVYNILEKKIVITQDTETDELTIVRQVDDELLDAVVEALASGESVEIELSNIVDDLECVDCDLESEELETLVAGDDTVAEVQAMNSGAELLTLGSRLNSARLAAIEPEFGGIITLAGIPSADGRFILQGALDMRQLPLPLLMKTVKGGQGHDGAVMAGVWSTMAVQEYEGFDALWGEGTFANTKDGQEARKLLAGGHMRGISVDFDQIEYEVTEDELGNEQLTFTYARAAGATFLSMPAFEEAFIAPIIKESNDALVASGGSGYSPVASVVFELSDFKELIEA